MDLIDLKKYIRDIPGFPKDGIIFHDITPLLQNSTVFSYAVDSMAETLKDKRVDYLIGVEARGFIFASALAYKLGCGLVIVRKLGKLPHEKINVTYDLEYGKDVLELHRDSITHGEKIALIDDLLATGGTAQAVGSMVQQLGANIVGYSFLIELTSLNGREKLKPHPVWSIMKYTE
jgi:adenine phosphoribosyltransferase